MDEDLTLISCKWICRNALRNILDIGRKKCSSDTKYGGQFGHGDDRRYNRNEIFKELYESLHQFFNTLMIHEITPFVIRAIREETRFIPQNKTPNDVVLPLRLSKYRCYNQWCYFKGFIPTNILGPMKYIQIRITIKGGNTMIKL